MAVTRIGNSSIRETGRDRSVRSGQVTVTLKYQGLYDELIAGEPAQGALWDEDTRFGVETASTQKTKAGHGETTVVYVYDGGLESIDTTTDIRIEVVWERDEVPLIFQKAFRDNISPNGGVQDIECQSLIEDYLQARTAAKRTAIKALIDAFGATATKYLELRVRGVDSVTRWLPIVRKTEMAILRPSSTGTDLGKRQVPAVGTVSVPSAIDVGNPLTGESTAETLAYILIQDDVSRTGRNKKWERTRQWKGYPASELQQVHFKA
jgi:hypothetical protein